ncbi:MAG: glycosyltransferase family 2 protein [Bacteroidota bacterium]
MTSEPTYLEKHPEAPEVSVVVPVYNSASSLEALFERTKATMEEIGKSWEMVMVYDGGDLECWEIMKGLKTAHPNHLTAIRLARNFGQHGATLCGINHSRGAFVVTIDDDLQTPPEEIPKLLARQEETDTDVVFGVYPNKQHGLLRNLGSRFLKAVFRYLVNGIRDGSSFRLITRPIADKIAKHRQHFVFLDQVIAWYTLDIAYVDVTHQKRADGKSGYSGWKLMRLAFNILISYTDLPLKIMTWTGLTASVLSLAIGTFFIVQKAVNGSAVGFTALIVAIFFSASIILLSLGILGEYIGRIYSARTEKPNYSIKTKL